MLTNDSDEDMETSSFTINFDRDVENLMMFTQIKHGKHKGDWINVGCVDMPISFIILQDAISDGRQILCTQVNSRLPYRVVAIGTASLKEARAWCTSNINNVAHTLGVGGSFRVATLISSQQSNQNRRAAKATKATKTESEVEKLERELQAFVDKIEKLQKGLKDLK